MRRKNEKIRRSNAVKLAADEWKYKLSKEQKMEWFQLSNERMLMDKIGNDGILLNSKNSRSAPLIACQ